MFTGIIEETGTVEKIIQYSNSAQLDIRASTVCKGTKTGESISVNGVCLTVTNCTPHGFTADVMAETLARSTLGYLHTGAKVNLERALTLSSRLGGHIVSGHIDGTGKILSISPEGISFIYLIECSEIFLRFVIPKGSVSIDGISLTVCSVSKSSFSVAVIPHTSEQTTLSSKKEGDSVNIECDIISKYLEKLCNGNIPSIQKSPDKITETFLQMHGFTEA